MWIKIWGIVILFSIVGFTYMSVKILYKGIGELKEMLTNLKKEHEKSWSDN